MKIVYNGIEFDVIHLHEATWEYVRSDDSIDYLYTHVNLIFTAMVCGQADVTQVGGPPVSYRSEGTEAYIHAEAVPSTPKAATGAPSSPPSPVTFDPTLKNRGAVRDRGQERSLPYSGEVTSFMWVEDSRPVVKLVKAPTSATLTHRLIRSRLGQSRGKLFIFSGIGDNPGELLLQSPDVWSDVCDAKGGPTPKILSLTGSRGDGNFFFVDFQIETFVRELSRLSTPDDPLISNRWVTTHSVDSDSFTTIHTDGVAVFDLGRLARTISAGDNLRPFLFQPIPQSFERGAIEVTGSEDGAVIRYQYVDKQVPYCFAAGPYAEATHISAFHKQAFNSDVDILSTAVNLMDSSLSRRANKRMLDADRSAGEDVTHSNKGKKTQRTQVPASKGKSALKKSSVTKAKKPIIKKRS